MARTPHETHDPVDGPELPFGVGKPSGPLDLVAPPDLLICPNCLEESEVETPAAIPGMTEAPPVFAFTQNDKRFALLTGFETAIRAFRAGRKEIGVIGFNVPTLEEALLRALRYELPLRGRPVTEVVTLLARYINETRLEPRSEELYSRLGVMDFDVSPVEALLNLDGDVITHLRTGAISETAAVCLAGIKGARDQRRYAKKVIDGALPFDRLKEEILRDCKLDRCYECTRRVWRAIPEIDGRLTTKFDYAKHPELEEPGSRNGGGGQ